MSGFLSARLRNVGDPSVADPFEVLLRANNVLLNNLRRDEASPELQKQLAQTGMSPSAHAYFCDPYTNSYLGPQVLVTVALVPPKRGVIQDSVAHMLVVATTTEVRLFAVMYDSASTSRRKRPIHFKPTNFKASTEGVSMLKIVGHANGRVFMAGKDGNLYELTYTVEYGFMYSVFYLGDSTGARKCKRLRHKSSGAPPSPVHALLALMGLRSADRTLVDIAVDSLRNLLYTLDLEGNMDLFDLGSSGNHTAQKMSRFNIWDAASKFCRWGSHSNLMPDQSIFKKPRKFNVVSMNVVDPTESRDVSLVVISDAGMRFYLSCNYSTSSRHNLQLSIVHIRCPPPEALWKYLSHPRSQSAAAPVPATPDGSSRGGLRSYVEAGGLGAGNGVVAHQHRQTQPPDGFPAKWERQGSSTPVVYGAYSSHGVTVMAETVENKNRLIFIGADVVTRSKRRREAQQEEHPWMREAVAVEGGESSGDVTFTRKVGQVWAIAERPVLLMDDPEAMRVRSSIVTSRAPSQGGMNSRANPSGGAPTSLGPSSSRTSSRQAGSGSGSSNSGSSGGKSTSTALVVRKAAAGVGVGVVNRAMQWGKEETYPERPVAPGPPVICCPEGSKGFPRGLLPKDLSRIVALPELGSQLFSAKREILCLTSAGLHAFVKLRPVDMLYELVAQPNNEKVQWFCEDFSRDQTMAMCFSIACGLPGDLGGLFSPTGEYADVVPSASAGVAAHELRKLALDAALKNCEPPCFSSPQAGGGSGGPIVMESVTIGEKFNNSALHNGLQLFTSRLLRPFWFQQVVKLSASTGSARNTGSKRSSDGKAKDGGELVGAPSFMDVRALRGPLELLKDAIRAVFPRSVENDLATEAAKSAMQASAAAEDVARMADRRLGFASRDRRATGRGLLYGSDRVGGMIDARRHGSPGVGLNGRGGAGGGMSIGSGIGSAGRQPETPSQRSQKALKLEAMEVHATYRLVTRALDAIRMIRVLTRVAEDFPKAKVPWIGLSGIALWKLVTGGEEHRRVSSLLADLVGPKVDLAPDARSALARELGTECPSYFSQGDARTFEGIELLRRAGSRARLGGWVGPEAAAPGQLQKLPPVAANDAEQGVTLLLEAAKDWKGERALGDDGQLARASAALSEVGRLDAVVDVCMTCSKNFKDGASTSTAIVPVDSMGGRGNAAGQALRSARPGHTGNSFGGSGVSGDVPSWEEGVYQGGAVVEPSDREKARDECYERVLDTVLALLRPNPAGVQSTRAGSSAEGPAASGGGSSVNGTEGRSAASSAIVPAPVGPPAELDRLIDRCLSYNAPDLNAKLFERLEAHDKSLLLRMKTQMTERHLEKDPDMLYRYFMLHKEFPKAVFLMDRLAHVDPSPEVHVRDRVDCLSKAISACHKCDLESSRVVMPGWSLNYGKLQALKDERDVLLVQERLLRDLQASMDPLDRLERQGRGTELLDGELSDRRDLTYEWRTRIVDPTELYSKASAFFLWEGCLHLLQCCEKDEPAVARKLIRSIIWREVPTKSCDGEDSRVQEFLNRARNRPAEIDVDDVRQEVDRAFPAKRDVAGEGGEESAKAGRLCFEDDWWFEPLLDKMAGLIRELLGRKAKYVLPVDTLLLELQDIADKYHGVGGPAPATCVVTRARQAGIPAVALLDVYESVTRHSYPLEENRRLRMLEVLVQLLKWTFEEPQPGLFAETVPMERLERIAFDCMSALNSLDLSAIDESQAHYKVDNLKLRLETLLGAMKAERMRW